MWEYLDTLYPNSYRRETKFGLLTVFGGNDNVNSIDALVRLSIMFCCSKNDAGSLFKKWIDSRPIGNPIPNSTNPDVLVYS